MPSATRQITSQAVRHIRDLRTSLADRRCDDLLIVKSAELLVRSSEALSGGVAHLDDALIATTREQARVAIASLGTLELRGEAHGVEQITDPVGRLICERQLPTVYLCHLIAEMFTGMEEGMRSLLLGTAATAVKLDAPTKRGRTSKRSPAVVAAQGSATTTHVLLTQAPNPDAGVDLYDWPSPAPATASAPSSGRIEIKPDTERI